MTKEEKLVVINSLAEQLQAYPHFYVADIEALNAEQTAALAHDLKTPLAIITGNADLLAEDENLTEAQKAQIAAMQRAAEKADRYLQTLRTVNTAETSPQEPIQRVQVQEILTRCANDAKLLCDNKNMQWKTPEPSPHKGRHWAGHWIIF